MHILHHVVDKFCFPFGYQLCIGQIYPLLPKQFPSDFTSDMMSSVRQGRGLQIFSAVILLSVVFLVCQLIN